MGILEDRVTIRPSGGGHEVFSQDRGFVDLMSPGGPGIENDETVGNM